MRDDYFGYMPQRCCECLHFEQLYSSGSVDRNAHTITRQALPFGECLKHDKRISRDRIDESGCYERD